MMYEKPKKYLKEALKSLQEHLKYYEMQVENHEEKLKECKKIRDQFKTRTLEYEKSLEIIKDSDD